MTTLGVEEALQTDIVAAVREAVAGAPKRVRDIGFSLVHARPIERALTPLIGLYLGFAVVRLPEVFDEVAIPHLPMALMLLFIALLAFAIPSAGWTTIWNTSLPLKLVMGLLVVSIVTVPIGYWPSESFQFLKERYFVSVVIFLTCLVFLRDRRGFRIAAIIYVLCSTAVAYNVVHTYDPNATIFNEDGDPIPQELIDERPELRRLSSVGVSLDSNDFGAIMATTFPLALWLSVGSFRRRLFWSASAGLMVWAIVPTQSRGTELGFVAAAAVIVAVGARGWRRWLSMGMILACVVGFVAVATGIGAGGRFADFGGDDYNVSGNEGRMFFWKQGMIWMLKRPWGFGIGNFPNYFGELNGAERAAHSSWVQYGMELGVTGLVLFIVLCVVLVRGLRQLRRRAAALRGRHPAAHDEEILAGHMLAVMVSVMVTGTFLSNAYYPLMYMALGMAAATLIGSPLNEIDDSALAPPALEPVRDAAGRRMRHFPAAMPRNSS